MQRQRGKVNTNGAISFLGTLRQFTPDPFPLSNDRRIVAPYWGDVDIRYGGNVSYRESTDPDLLTRATNEIHNVFPQQYKFHASWIFIATWDNVPFYGANSIGMLKCKNAKRFKYQLTHSVFDLVLQRNTFQCVLITNGRHSFAMFLYKKLTWTTGTASNGDNSTGLGGTPAQVGMK
ncbi:hypothetical protein KUTeg_022715 [Tegillarca granosa]|uniref:NIDO domain-containing protein n=1 Tax=Tegillarca granosa TaxID=220873 RepID=A0ABQ9E0G4_TEGGR|nr:hypothetical protein KUTeg_022715 [Tegillarca granosa]